MLMSINVIEINGSDCKYVEIFTHRVGSIGAPSRRTVLIRGTNTKQWEVPNNNNNNNNKLYEAEHFLRSRQLRSCLVTIIIIIIK
jgi:hypothetical protein